jgi:CcmD family protein
VRRLKQVGGALALVALFLTAPAWGAQPPQTPPGQEEFVPLAEIPPEEQIPAFTLVAAAYALVWVVLIGYVWSVSRRLTQVERELAALPRKDPDRSVR